MDLYHVLGVRRNAALAEIRRAYQRHARRLHPALNPGDPEAAQRFQALAQAFEVLSHPERRAQYDRGDVQAAPASLPDVQFAGFDFSADGGAGGIGFRQIFEGVLQPRHPASAPRGEDLEQAATIAFEECFHGTRRRLHLLRQDQCSGCGGTGQVETGPSPCAECHGAGQVRAHRGHMIFARTCSACGGTGVTTRRPCAHCGGEGRAMNSEWVDVEIPAGVADGSRVHLAGLGNAGRHGGPPGDFNLVVYVEPHAFYRREGDDLFCEIPVTITEAALGGHLEVPTPDGPVTIEIPAGTQTGQRFRLRKRGMPRPGEKGRGDVFVETRVWVPPVADDESRELLREFARRNQHDPRKDLGPRPAMGKTR